MRGGKSTQVRAVSGGEGFAKKVVEEKGVLVRGTSKRLQMRRRVRRGYRSGIKSWEGDLNQRWRLMGIFDNSSWLCWSGKMVIIDCQKLTLLLR